MTKQYNTQYNTIRDTIFFLSKKGNQIASDLAFLRPISIVKRTEVTKGAAPTIIFCLIDCFSRFCQLRVCKTATADEIYEKFQECLPFFAPNNHYTTLVTDRGGEFGKGLGKRLGLKHVYLSTGPHKKVSLIERQIRSWKALFFRFLLRFPTVKNYEHLIHLTQIAFNSKSHKGLFQFNPHLVQHFDYAASVVFRKSLVTYEKHQSDAFLRYQTLHENRKLKINDVVRIRYPKKLIRKESSVFYPQVSEETYVIKKILTQRLPYQYILENRPTDEKFYAWSLMKVNPLIEKENDLHENKAIKEKSLSKPVIVVNNIIPQVESKLRSGKKYAHAFEMSYDITNNGTRQFVDGNTLKLYKRLFGPKILTYDQDILNDSHLKKYII